MYTKYVGSEKQLLTCKPPQFVMEIVVLSLLRSFKNIRIEHIVLYDIYHRLSNMRLCTYIFFCEKEVSGLLIQSLEFTFYCIIEGFKEKFFWTHHGVLLMPYLPRSHIDLKLVASSEIAFGNHALSAFSVYLISICTFYFNAYVLELLYRYCIILTLVLFSCSATLC